MLRPTVTSAVASCSQPVPAKPDQWLVLKMRWRQKHVEEAASGHQSSTLRPIHASRPHVLSQCDNPSSAFGKLQAFTHNSMWPVKMIQFSKDIVWKLASCHDHALPGVSSTKQLIFFDKPTYIVYMHAHTALQTCPAHAKAVIRGSYLPSIAKVAVSGMSNSRLGLYRSCGETEGRTVVLFRQSCNSIPFRGKCRDALRSDINKRAEPDSMISRCN
eukprot:1128999-Amphidinium_carterae.1